MKKLLLILLLIGLTACVLVGCNPAVPAEGEGEGEGEPEEVARVVLVELFSQEGCANCAIVEPILDQLVDEYERSEMVLVEQRAYGIYSLDEIRDRYEWYFPSSSDRGTPNILFNGFNTTHIHGTSSYYVIKAKIETERSKDAKISITATRSGDSSTTTISGTIENVSSSTLSNLVINGMIFKDRGKVGLKYSVTDIFAEQAVGVSTLAPGDSYSFSFTLGDINWEDNNYNGVIFVQAPNSSKKEVLQALYID